MLVIPTVATPSQTLTVQLAGQPTQLNIYQKSTGLFCDVYVNDSLIIGGVLCLDANRLVRSQYLGFIGDLAFYDMHGAEDPLAAGLGIRWILVYLEAADLDQ
jgi:hypothetical protein